MILRNVAIRHGRKALSAPIRKSCLRSISTDTINSEDAQPTQAIERNIENHGKDEGAESKPLHIMQQFIPPHQRQVVADPAVSQKFYAEHRVKKRTANLGSVIERHYEPEQLLLNPPKPEQVTLELLMASQAHLGHSTSLWNPMNQRYIYGIRQGIHIISLEETAAHLRRAAKVVEGVAYHGGIILFVGTRKGQEPAVVKAAQMAKACHLFEKWTPGTLTNGDILLKGCAIQAVDRNDEPVEGFEDKLADWKALMPDLVVVMNPMENYILLHECGLNNIPTIGVIDTNANPTWVTYPIPANDDSLRCIQVISGVLGRAGEAGHKKRLEAAQKGQVTWFPPRGLGHPAGPEDMNNTARPGPKSTPETKSAHPDTKSLPEARFLDDAEAEL